MCVAAIAWNAHPRWRLVVAGNRDEFHARQAAPLQRWDNGILAGRDLEAGGTWLGISEAGRFALVTNHRVDGYPVAGAPTRGGLVTGWLGDEDLGAVAAMNPFNLFACSAARAMALSNYPMVAEHPLAAGIHGLSNGAWGNRWTKTARLEQAIGQWLDSNNDDPALLFDALADRAPDSALWLDGPSPEFSSVFIANPVYGTRCSTVVLLGSDGDGQIIERRFSADGTASGETALAFRWPSYEAE